jgi:hypothetical protein
MEVSSHWLARRQNEPPIPIGCHTQPSEPIGDKNRITSMGSGLDPAEKRVITWHPGIEPRFHGLSVRSLITISTELSRLKENLLGNCNRRR